MTTPYREATTPRRGDTAPREPVRIRLDEVDKQALAGEGNFLYRIPLRDGFAVAKIYEGSRGRWLHLKKTFGNVVLTGRSSHMPSARCRTEIDCIRVWESHGFRCFGMLPEVALEGVPRHLYMVYEYVPGCHFREYFGDSSIPLEQRIDTWRRWIPEWYRRHRIAIETRDPRLIQENGDVKHVMLWEDDFVYFDFEMVYRSRNLRQLVGREILAYMRSVGRFFGDELYDRMLDELVAHYPDKVLLHSAWEAAFRCPNPLMRLGRALERNLKPSNRKRYSKYNVARDIKRRLDETSLTYSG
jgi:hypothetical protein